MSSAATSGRSSANIPRRLWIINHYAATGAQAGGSRHLDIAATIEKSGWNTEIFACSYDHVSRTYSVPTSWWRPVIHQNVRGTTFHWVHSIPYADNSWRRYLNILVFSLYVLAFGLFRRRRPDAVLGSSAHLFAPLVAWVLARRYRSVFVVEVRDLWPDSLIQLGLSNRRVIGLLRWIEGFVYARASIIIGVSQGIVDGIIRNGGDPNKTVLISHGIETDPGRFDVIARREAIRSELGWDNQFVVLWAGSMEPFNGLDIVIEGARLLVDDPVVRVVLLGSGSMRSELERRAVGIPNVEIAHSVPRQESFRWMVAADAGMLVAREFEAFTGTRPRKIFDYMAAGLPILCFVPGEASSLIDEAHAGVVRTWVTPESFASAVRWARANPEAFSAMGRNGLQAVGSAYSLDRSTEILLAQLNAAIDGQPLPSASNAEPHQPSNS